MPIDTQNMNDIESYLSGDRLYGDDLSLEEIRTWYADEEEGYANLGAGDSTQYSYVYHALNWYHAFRKVKTTNRMEILGFGSAYGEELQPLLNRAKSVTIVDPSDAFRRDEIHGVPCRYVKPLPSGVLEFEDASFDMVTAFGVLHHVPNVSFVMSEISRVTRSGGIFLLREPVVSMGDWRFPRAGLTKHERGIPLHLMQSIIHKSGFHIRSESLCVFPPLRTIFKTIKPDIYNSRILTILDAWASRAFAWNLSYHPRNSWKKVRPSAAFYVLEKI